VVAGDFVRNSFGIASVEGAILSAKQAAICLSRYLGLRREPQLLCPRDVSNDDIRRRKLLMEPLKAQALAALGERRHEVPTRSSIFE
jgi:hypothetical protein